MPYELHNFDRSYNQAVTKIYRARQRAAEMQRLGDEMRKLQEQMNHTFLKSTERWYDTRSHGSLQISGGSSEPVRVETHVTPTEEARESQAQLDAEFQAEREKEAEVDPLNRVLDLKKKVEGFTQAEEEARDRARKAKIMCLAIAVGFSAGGILASSLLASIICAVFGLIFLAGALSPAKNNSLVITAIENRKDAQAQLDKATTEWLKAEGLS